MKRWASYAKPYKAYFILGPLCMIIEVIGEALMPKFLANIIDYGTGQSDISEAASFYQWLYAHTGGASPFIVAIMCAMVLTAAFMMLGGVGGAYFGAKASVNYAADLRSDIYKKVQQFSFANIDKFSTGSLVTRLTNDVTQIQNFINMLLRMCLRSPGMMIGGVIMAVMVSGKLTLCLLMVLPMIVVSVFFLVKVALPRFTRQQGKIDALNSTVQENVTNIRVVKSFVREEHEKEKFGKANSELKQSAFDAMRTMIMMQPAMTLFMNITIIAICWFGGNMLIKSELTAGSLTAFITYIIQILMSLVMMTMIFVSLSRAMASGKRIAEVLDEETDIKDNSSEQAAELTVQNGEIEFRNVSFRYYKNSDAKVLDNVSLKIPAGGTVGIIGSTGSGKSTLVSMIARLYDADEGEVLVDGRNVKDYRLYNLREGIGFVLQKNLLFSGTIRDNLLWGNPQAGDEEIKEMASYAQADNFITSFDDGYNTIIEQGGTNVSGGQKQRLCIARALLKKPKILVLDDSTSAVDTATEKRIREAFANELKGSTKIIIAQRISSVKDSDMIVVLDDGKVTGVGTHEELLAGNEEYQEIYWSQVDRKEGA
ncbi:MAG: ABC transporter ATP-binding protein [Clostridia bacterium]|nr:ABC transporter ATP-binding protein [Clostridia bacterium]